jgi:hypothetical protein
MNKNQIFADKHQIMKLGPATGHVVTPIAFCRNEEVAAELVKAINEVEIFREALDRLAKMTPVRANARTSTEQYNAVKAVAETALSGGDIGPEQPWLTRYPEDEEPANERA